jgi:predicted dehydrogenase
MKVGVVGIGRWGMKVAREYITLMNEGVVDSVILCDVNSSRLNLFADVAVTSNHIDEVLHVADGIHICTPNSTHHEIARRALEAGAHVLMEKPMTTNHSKAYELVEIAMSKNLTLQVGHIYRFANVIRKIKELYKSNYFGDVYYFNLTWTHLVPSMEGVDILWDLLPHPLDILNFITGKWPVEFVGVSKAFRRSKLSEVATLQAVYDDKTFANIHLSWLTPVRRRILEIVGSKRVALVECVRQKIKIYERNDEGKLLEVESNNTIRDMILNFIDAVKTGKNDFNSSMIGVRSVETIEKAIRSLK